LQRTLENISARRKRRKIAKRQYAKAPVSNCKIHEDKPANSILITSTDDHSHDQLLACKKFRMRNAKEIDEIELKGLQEKYKQRLVAAQMAEKDSESDADKEFSDFESNSTVDEERDTKAIQAYAALVNESVSSSRCIQLCHCLL